MADATESSNDKIPEQFGSVRGPSRSSDHDTKGKGENANGGFPRSTLSIPNYNREMMRVERHFYYVGYGCIIAYAFLLLKLAVIMGWLNEPETSQLRLTPLERSAAFLAFLCLVLVILLQYFPLFVFKKNSEYSKMSGVVFVGLTVASLAACSNALMAFGSFTPIRIDPVTGARVHLLRWVEWTVLAGAMTFLVESCDVPDPGSNDVIKWAYIHGGCQSLSTYMGFLFPFAGNFSIWMILMIVAIACYLVIVERLRAKRLRFEKIEKGSRLDELEIYNRSLIALQLLTTCNVGWGLLVACYFIFCCFGPRFASHGSLLAHPSAPMIIECILDVLLKSFYNFYIVSMHEHVFDEQARAKRRLEELRQSMWANSSDILALSVMSMSGVVTTTVSPTFFSILRQGRTIQKQKGFNWTRSGMCFELTSTVLNELLAVAYSNLEDSNNNTETKKETPVIKPRLFDFSLGTSSLPDFFRKPPEHSGSVTVPEDVIGIEEMQALATLIARSWQCMNRDTILPHDLILNKGKNDRQLETIQCEALVTRLEETALFVVVRDISERYRRFEAEKLALSEMTARQRDSEANRFTRHEVKNGLLSSLGLCEGIVELAKQNQTPHMLEEIIGAVDPRYADYIHSLASTEENVMRMAMELDSTLREVLDTVLTEVMARDVIHGVYKPQKEPLDVVKMLRDLAKQRQGSTERFIVTTDPDPFPLLLVDRHLTKCVYRNAISNACKYGARKKPIKTHLTYDNASRVFRMMITNEAGDHHDELQALGADGVRSVFEKGKRLHSGMGSESSSLSRHSSGDGAWIMQQCCRCVSGACSIEFQAKTAVFSCWWPASRYEPLRDQSEAAASGFSFPKNTWGIALDDSKIQRKLLQRFLKLAGIPESRSIIRGETAEEISRFDDYMFDFISSHPGDYFLLIVDENLDVAMEDVSLNHATFSGSLLVQRLRHQLLPEQELQMLALIRSANDSLHDVAVYNSRAHGFIPKAPLNPERIQETLSALWTQRFSKMEKEDSSTDLDSRRSSLVASMDTSFGGSIDDPGLYIMEHIRAVDKMIASSERSYLERQWPEIWEKLHAFKGDLVCLNDSEVAISIASKINTMRGSSIPPGFTEKYTSLRELVEKLD